MPDSFAKHDVLEREGQELIFPKSGTRVDPTSSTAYGSSPPISSNTMDKDSKVDREGSDNRQ